MPGRILIADDSANIREVLQINLETLGYEVLLAEDGDQALRRVYRDHPDLLVLDVMMPRQNGFQVCRKVKSDPDRADTPVILLTAKSQREDVYWGKDCGADEYMTKPFSAKELEGVIERLLARRSGSGRPADRLEDEVERRRGAGAAGALCVLRWDPRAMDVMRKKYGEVRYAESVERLRREGEGLSGAGNAGGRIEFVDGLGFRILLSGDRSSVEARTEALCRRLTRLARGFYDAADREREGIEIRDFRTGETHCIPLLSFTAEVNAFGR